MIHRGVTNRRSLMCLCRTPTGRRSFCRCDDTGARPSNKRSRSNSATPSQCRWRVSGRHRGFVEAAAKRSSVDHVAVRIFVTISATDLSARSIEYRRSCSSNCLLINCTTGLVRPANCVAWNCRLRLSWQKLRRTDLLQGMLTVLDWVIWHHEWKESATF